MGENGAFPFEFFKGIEEHLWDKSIEFLESYKYHDQDTLKVIFSTSNDNFITLRTYENDASNLIKKTVASKPCKTVSPEAKLHQLTHKNLVSY